jgi:hypothetical protein
LICDAKKTAADLAQNAMANQQAVQPAAAPAAIKGGYKKVTIFNSGDGPEWSTWRSNFITIKEINKWDDLRARREASASLEGMAKKAVQDINPEAITTLVELLDLYEKRFRPQSASELNREEFNKAQQKFEETPTAWAARIRDLFERAYPTELVDSTRLLERFVMGIENKTVRSFVYRARSETFEHAIDRLNDETAAEKRLSDDRDGLQSWMHAIRSDALEGKQYAVQWFSCNFCGRQGHTEKECRTKMAASDQAKLVTKDDKEKFNLRATKRTEKFEKSKPQQHPRGRGRARGRGRGLGQQRSGRQMAAIIQNCPMNWDGSGDNSEE